MTWKFAFVKISTLIFFLLYFNSDLFSQAILNREEKISSLCKVWGFLKYYHPEIGKGKIDWDAEFLRLYSELDKCDDKVQLSKLFLNCIQSLGVVVPCKNCQINSGKERIIDSRDFSWFDNDKLFTDSLSSVLNYIMTNKESYSNYYSDSVLPYRWFRNEKTYPDSVFPSEPMRMLCLARYWNIINYFFPYKYVIGKNWNEVIDQVIPEFISSENPKQYHLAMMKMIAATNDSHASFHPDANDFGKYQFPFGLRYVEGKLVVSYLRNDSLASLDDVRLNDVIVSIDGESVDSLVEKYSKYISASNIAVIRRNVPFFIVTGEEPTAVVVIERGNEKISKTIQRFPEYKISKKEKVIPGKVHPWKTIEGGEIGYVHMEQLTSGDVNQMMKDLANTKAIIFDVRNYPKGTMYAIAKHLNKNEEPFALFTKADHDLPGVFRYTEPYYCGKKNKKYYRGKVVVLFNEYTQSHAEFTCMALKTAPDVTFIGSQTAGADGNVVNIPLPGNYNVYMTGLGVFYPDGTQTQRIGIVPDIKMKRTINGYINGKDEFLERALEFIRNGK